MTPRECVGGQSERSGESEGEREECAYGGFSGTEWEGRCQYTA